MRLIAALDFPGAEDARRHQDLRQALAERFLIFTPGIRLVANMDDQKRVVNVEQAFKNGADYILPLRYHSGLPVCRRPATEISLASRGISGHYKRDYYEKTDLSYIQTARLTPDL